MSVDLAWQIDETEVTDNTPPPPAPRRPRRIMRVLAMLAVLAFCALAGFFTWALWQQRFNETQATADIERVIALEAQSVTHGDKDLFSTLLDPQAPPAWRTQHAALRTSWQLTAPVPYSLSLRAVRFVGEYAWVELAETRPEYPLAGDDLSAPDPPAYHFTRVAFYRRDPQAGWLITAPTLDLDAWSVTQTLTTTHFVATYRAPDKARAQHWLATLEPYAAQVCADFNCPPDLHWTVTFAPSELSGKYDDAFILDEREFTLASPSLSGYRDDGALSGVAGAQIPTGVLLSAIRITNIPGDDRYDNQPLYSITLAGVLLWDIESASTALNAPALTTLWQRLAYTRDFTEALPLLCRTDNPRYVPLNTFGTGPIGDTSRDYWLKLLQSYTLIDFLVARGERAHLGTLLRATRSAQSFGAALQTALPDVDVDTFEAEWLADCRTQYAEQ